MKKELFFVLFISSRLNLFKSNFVAGLFIIVFLSSGYTLNAQNNNIETTNLYGTVSVTNKGISLIPTFSLGRPALVSDFNIDKGKFSFNPELRFELEGFKPWSFVFWFRHKTIESEQFNLSIGAHPAYVFKEVDLSDSGYSNKSFMTRRYVAAEIDSKYSITDKISVNPYYLIAHGVGGDERNYIQHFLSLRSEFSNIGIIRDLSLNLSPQIYYLNMDGVKGYYVAWGIAFNKENCPFSIVSMFNKIISTEIDSDDFIWDISLVYSFNKKYRKE